MTDLTLILDDEGDSQHIHRIERSSLIEPGRYWRCTKSVKGINKRWETHAFDFTAGCLYLLTRLEFFDGKLHSVVMLDDPAHGTDSGILTLDLLLKSFEQVDEADATAFRQKQILQVQGEAADIQTEMAEATANPALLQSVIAEGLAEWERELARNRPDDEDSERKPKSNLPALSTNGRFDLTAAIDHKIRPTDIAVFRHMAQREGKIAEIRGKWLTKKVEELGRVLKNLAPFFSEHAAIGMARAQDALDMAQDVEKGLRSLRLYTGEGVTINTLMTGASAPADEPLTVYQRKLHMAEEFAVWSDVDRMFDHTKTEEFFEALVNNEALRQQLIPAPRGVLAMSIRRTDCDYSAKTIAQALENAERNKVNKALFLLVRDGDNWHQVWSDEPSHEISPRLFPTRDEMDALFDGIDGETVGFEDLRFTNRATDFDRKSLSYKRFLILACGLDHRLKLFGEFYPENRALSFISMPFQRTYMRFIADDDSDAMLGDNVGSVHGLISRNHAQLAAGCRVMVFGRELLQHAAAPGAFSPGGYRKEPSILVRARNKFDILTVHRDKDDLVVRLPVKRIDKVTYDGWGQRRVIQKVEYEVRVALNKLDGEDLGYLLMDIVKAEELRPFIYSRVTRASSVDYIYGFKIALQELGAAERTDAPGRAQLMERAVSHFGLTKVQAEAAVMSAIQTWREKNPDVGALPALTHPEFAKVDFELAEAAWAYTHGIPKVTKQIEALGGKVVRIMRAKKGSLVAYYEQPDAERDLRVHHWAWAGRRVFNAAGKMGKDAPETLWLLDGRIIGEYELMRVDSPLIHRHKARQELDNLQLMLDKTAEMAEILTGAFKGERQGVSDRAWLTFTSKRKDDCNHNGTQAANNELVLLPLGVATHSNDVLGVRVRIYDLLYLYGSDAQRAFLMEQGYELPKPEKDHNRKIIPYEGVALALDMGGGTPGNFTGPFQTGLSHYARYALLDAKYKGKNRLNHSLAKIPSMVKDPQDNPGHFSPAKTLDGATVWFPELVRAKTGEFLVSEMFPGLPTA